MTTKIPQKCTESRIPQKNHCWPARFCSRWSDMAGWLAVSWCPRTVSVSRPASPRAPLAGKSHKSAQNPGSPRKMREAQRSTQLPSPWQPVAKVPWKARRTPAVARRKVRRMAIRVISSDERQSRRPQMSVAQRVRRKKRATPARLPGERGATFLERPGVTPSVPGRVTPPA